MRYRPTKSLTLDPEVVKEAEARLPVGKIHSFSVLVEWLLRKYLKMQ